MLIPRSRKAPNARKAFGIFLRISQVVFTKYNTVKQNGTTKFNYNNPIQIGERYVSVSTSDASRFQLHLRLYENRSEKVLKYCVFTHSYPSTYTSAPPMSYTYSYQDRYVELPTIHAVVLEQSQEHNAT